jgi:hypothetical protein
MAMNRLTLFGFVAVSLMLLFYALEDRSPMFVLAFAVACAMGSIYDFWFPMRSRLDWWKASGRWWRCDAGIDRAEKNPDRFQLRKFYDNDNSASDDTEPRAADAQSKAAIAV